MKMKNIKFKFFAVLLAGLFLSFTIIEQDPWVVPDNYNNMNNPVAADDESLDIGKSIYNKHCKSCHGKEGWGDGSKAAQLETPSGDFTEDYFTSQSDGSIFYKTIKGRGDMPGFEKKIPDSEDVWHVVNYVRSFAE